MPTDMEAETTELEPLHVVLDKPGGEKDVAADWGSWQTYAIGPGIPPQQILPQSNKRKEAELIVQTAAALSSLNSSATVAAPVAAGQLITSVVLQPGQYVVNWTIQLSGTTGAADVSNYQLMLNGVQLATSTNPSTVGTVFAQVQVTVGVTVANSVLSVNAIALPTATAGYRASLAATPQTSTGFVRVGTRAQVMNNQGGQLQTGRYPYEAKQELWCGTDGATQLTVTVLDERYE